MSDLLYEGYEILSSKPKINDMPSMEGSETLLVHLKNRISGFVAELYYTVYDDCDVIACRTVYKNCGTGRRILNRAYSFSFALPGGDYEALSLHGALAREAQIQRTPLQYGVISIDSKRASSSAAINPFMAVITENATEAYGNCFGFSLVYSSSFVLKAEISPDGTAVVSGGINDFDFKWKLDEGECLETPEVVIAFSSSGIGGMSREYHNAYREHLINKRFVKADRP